MDVVTICVGTDQNLIVLKPLCQFQSTGMRCDWIDLFTFRETLHHVVEHFSVSLVVEQLGTQEVIVDTFGTAVDASDQFLFLPERFCFPLHIPHHQSHAGTTLPLFVVGEIYDCDNSPPPVFL